MTSLDRRPCSLAKPSEASKSSAVLIGRIDSRYLTLWYRQKLRHRHCKCNTLAPYLCFLAECYSNKDQFHPMGPCGSGTTFKNPLHYRIDIKLMFNMPTPPAGIATRKCTCTSISFRIFDEFFTDTDAAMTACSCCNSIYRTWVRHTKTTRLH